MGYIVFGPITGTAPVVVTGNDVSVTAVGSGSVALQGSLTTYTPTWTSAGSAPAIGNGSITGYYYKTGKLVTGFIYLQTGTTTTYGSANAWTFSTPSTMANSNYFGGGALGFNSGVANYVGICVATSTTVFQIISHNSGSAWYSTNPAAWGGAGATYMKFYFQYFE